MEIIGGDFFKFSNIIQSKLKVGLYEKKPVVFIELEPSEVYIKESQGKEIKKNNGLKEIVVEVIDGYIFEVEVECHGLHNKSFTQSIVDKQYLVTRQVGTDDTARWVPYTRISLMYERDGQIRVWSPTFEELFSVFKDQYKFRRNLLRNLRRIFDTVAVSNDLAVCKVIDFDGQYDFDGISRTNFDDIPIVAYYSLLKQILISEDIRYPQESQYGRYLTILALLDYLHNDEKYSVIKQKYSLPD